MRIKRVQMEPQFFFLTRPFYVANAPNPNCIYIKLIGSSINLFTCIYNIVKLSALASKKIKLYIFGG